jgi:hypothetical protein
VASDPGAHDPPPLPGRPADAIMKWYWPGGDIEQLRQCSAACVAMANAADHAKGQLSTAGKAALPDFKGAAAGALEADLHGLDDVFGQFSTHLRKAAKAIDSHIEIKEEQKRQSYILWAITAVTLGTVVAGGAVAADLAAAGAMTEAMIGLETLVTRITKSSILYTGAFGGAQYLIKAGQAGSARDPSTWGPALLAGLDPDKYSATDVAFVLGATPYTAGYLKVLDAVGILGANLTGAQAMAMEAKTGGLDNAVLGVGGAFGLAGKALTDPEAWGWGVGLPTGFGTVGGVLAAKVAEPLANLVTRIPYVGPAFDYMVGAAGMRTQDFTRVLLTSPADISVAAGAQPDKPPVGGAVTTEGLSPLGRMRFQPPPADGQPAVAPPAPTPTPDTLWEGNARAPEHQADLQLLQQKLITHGAVGLKVGDSWEATTGPIGWFKAANGFWPTTQSAQDHSVTPQVWQALMQPPKVPAPAAAGH